MGTLVRIRTKSGIPDLIGPTAYGANNTVAISGMNGWDWIGRPDVGKSGNENFTKIATDNLSQKKHQFAIEISKTALGCFQNTFVQHPTFFLLTQNLSVAHSLVHQLNDSLTDSQR